MKWTRFMAEENNKLTLKPTMDQVVALLKDYGQQIGDLQAANMALLELLKTKTKQTQKQSEAIGDEYVALCKKYRPTIHPTPTDRVRLP